MLCDGQNYSTTFLVASVNASTILSCPHVFYLSIYPSHLSTSSFIHHAYRLASSPQTSAVAPSPPDPTVTGEPSPLSIPSSLTRCSPSFLPKPFTSTLPLHSCRRRHQDRHRLLSTLHPSFTSTLTATTGDHLRPECHCPPWCHVVAMSPPHPYHLVTTTAPNPFLSNVLAHVNATSSPHICLVSHHVIAISLPPHL